MSAVDLTCPLAVAVAAYVTRLAPGLPPDIQASLITDGVEAIRADMAAHPDARREHNHAVAHLN